MTVSRNAACVFLECMRAANVPSTADIQLIFLLQVDASGTISCSCSSCLAWDQYVKGQLPGGPAFPQYEVLTSDFIGALADYIRHMLCLKPS